MAGITVEQAIEECIVRSWITFKADWYSKPTKAQSREEDLQWFLNHGELNVVDGAIKVVDEIGFLPAKEVK